MKAKAAVGALKASYIICNIAANLPEATPHIIKLSPLLIALLGITYGPALCQQCAWALGNLAAASPTAATTLLRQGAIPSLLNVIDDAARTPTDEWLTAAGSTCAWTISNIVCTAGSPRPANVLLSLQDPSMHLIAKRVFTSAAAASDLVLEVAWLLVHTLRWAAPGSHALACREPLSHSVLAAAEAAAAATGPEAAACLMESRARWCDEPPLRPPSPRAAPRPDRGLPPGTVSDAAMVPQPMEHDAHAPPARTAGATGAAVRETEFTAEVCMLVTSSMCTAHSAPRSSRP